MYDFNGQTLVRSIRATFGNRKTELSREVPIALSDTFATDPSKRIQWKAFLRKANGEALGDLSDVINELRGFAGPLLTAAASGVEFGQQWIARRPWRE